MARLELRVFGSKKQLLVLPSKSEATRLLRRLRGKEHDRFEAELKFDDQWQPYLVLEKKGTNDKS